MRCHSITYALNGQHRQTQTLTPDMTSHRTQARRFVATTHLHADVMEMGSVWHRLLPDKVRARSKKMF